MSFNPNNVTAMNHPLKIFVKESNNIEKAPVKKVISKLGFQGLEAKNAYEEAISSSNEKSQSDNKTKKTVPRKKKFFPKKNSNEDNFNHCEIKTNVSVNSIFKAIESNDLTFLKRNLHPDNINTVDEFGWTPLMSAAYSGNAEIVAFFLRLKAKRNIKDKSGLTAMNLALKNKFPNIVKLLSNDEKQKIINNSPVSAIITEKINFFCNVCNSNFENITKTQHETSIVHIFNTKPKVPAAHYIVPKGNKGYQMLINSGWDEEHGLGPSGEGRKYPVKTTLKQDRKGFGLEEKTTPKITHFKPNDRLAIKTTIRAPSERKLKKWQRDRHLQREAQREKNLRKALS